MAQIEQIPEEAASQTSNRSGQLLIYEDGGLNIQVRLDGETVWLTQRLIAELYQISTKTVSEHLVNIYEEGELALKSTTRNFQIVQIEGARRGTQTVDHYNLDAVFAVGYRVRSDRVTKFRQWATARLSELLVKGFTLDDERIEAGTTIGKNYFDELLERIRDIRASERLFYQKITDIYATSIDYDKLAIPSQNFFALVQNKMHWAAHGHTAAKIMHTRADASKRNIGLTTWKNGPRGAIRKTDITIAKNYLSIDEITELNRIVTMYLDYAEDQARRHIPMHMANWIGKVNAFLEFNDRNVLKAVGKISHEPAKDHTESEDSVLHERCHQLLELPMKRR